VALERKRKATQAQTQTEITILLVCLIIGLIMLVLLFADQSFFKSNVEPLGSVTTKGPLKVRT
jgi:hypothetical protein